MHVTQEMRTNENVQYKCILSKWTNSKLKNYNQKNETKREEDEKRKIGNDFSATVSKTEKRANPTENEQMNVKFCVSIYSCHVAHVQECFHSESVVDL